MILADHLGQLRRAQPVGERARRLLVETGGGEQVGHGSPIPRHPGRSAVESRDRDTRLLRIAIPDSRPSASSGMTRPRYPPRTEVSTWPPRLMVIRHICPP